MALTISVSGVEYESPSLKSLQESFKKNVKISSFKSAYADGVATISLDYPGTAEQLWETVPAANKKGFKVNSLNDKEIVLVYTNSKGAAIPTEKNIETKPVSNKTGDCNSCDYFPLCSYDATRSFEGKLYYGIDKGDGMIYYRIDNGILIQKIKFRNDWGYKADAYSTRTMMDPNFRTDNRLK